MHDKLRSLLVKIANVNEQELGHNLLIFLLCGHGVLRSIDWITMSTESLEKVSPIYNKLSHFLDIHALGWLFLLFSITLLLSMFFKGQPSYIFLMLGAIGSAVCHLIFGVIATEGATLFVTYYFMLLIGIVQIILCVLGGAQLWKIKHLKK
ncbi:hypothetical protein JTZ62_04335 [Mammaliicoccus sciuri]|uniref:hypothetical protein n=1 Tax=Mammaliicoccus sciuri TaxID=1296 RepID=UPI0019D39599|nr:hypothetical protein [Mammaliicoccus sciuri]QSN68390.1 hypothetical protein JTZ62_04335 [Mammaliicoccus sciuri]UIU26033.1 hypothetical protein LLZ92_04345 [Mammaliicoccus sciuri]